MFSINKKSPGTRVTPENYAIEVPARVPTIPSSLLDALNQHPKSTENLTEENLRNAYFIFHLIDATFDLELYHITKDHEATLERIINEMESNDEIEVFKINSLNHSHQNLLQYMIFDEQANASSLSSTRSDLLRTFTLPLHSKLNGFVYEADEDGKAFYPLNTLNDPYRKYTAPPPEHKKQSLCSYWQDCCVGFFTFQADNCCFEVLANLNI